MLCLGRVAPNSSRIVALLAKRDSMQTPPIRNANRVRQVNIQRLELSHARIAIQEHLRVHRNLRLAYFVIRAIMRPGSVIPNVLLAPPVATRQALRIRGAFLVPKAIINRIRQPNCIKCEMGKVANANRTECLIGCALEKHIPIETSTECVDCPAGRFGAADATYGGVPKCIPCSTGTYKSSGTNC